MKKILLISTCFLILIMGINLISATGNWVLYDSASANNVNDNFNTSSNLFSFVTDHYQSGNTASNEYNIFQNGSLGITGFNATFSMSLMKGTGQAAIFTLGEGEGAAMSFAPCDTNYLGIKEGYAIALARNRTMYCVFSISGSTPSLLYSKAISDFGNNTYVGVNLTYDGATVGWKIGSNSGSTANSDYTVSSQTGFMVDTYYGLSGTIVKIKDMYINNEVPNPLVTLISLPNNSLISVNNTNLVTNFNISASDPYSYEWINTTFFVWKDSTYFNVTTFGISGTDDQYNFSLDNLSIGNYLWNNYACYGNLTFKNCTWSSNGNFTFEWRPFDIISQGYNPFVYETSHQNLNLTISTISSTLTINSKLIYDGSEYDGTTNCVGEICDIYSVIDVPLVSTGENENKSFYWSITVYDGTSSYNFNTTSTTKEQNVTRIHLEKCDATYTNTTLNFTAYDEQNLSRINHFYIEGTFNFWIGGGSVYRNNSFLNTSTPYLALCILPINKIYYTNSQLQYKYDDENTTYVPRDYYFSNATLTNVSQSINLYLLNAEDSTTFIIKIQDQKLSPIQDAFVYIQRYYPSTGQYKTVQVVKTGSNGESVGFYEVEIADYRHLIMKDGVLLLQTSPEKVVGKEVPFTLTFTVGSSLNAPWTVFEGNPNILTTMEYNDTTKILTFTYIDITDTITNARLIVYKASLTNSSNITICDSISTESSASITCNMTGYSGTFVAKGYIDSSISNVLQFIISEAKEIFGNEGLFMGWFIILTSAFAFIWNPTAGIIAINAAIILTNVIGLISFSPIFIFSIIGISIIAMIVIKT